MKKFIIFLFMTITMCVNANAQNKIDWEWFKGRNLLTFTIGGELWGSYKNVQYEPSYVWGMSISCLGIYYDWGCSTPQGINSLDLGRWTGTSADYKHIGYTIPISRYFTITPLYGTITTRKGIVDGDDWYVSNVDGVTNRFKVEETHTCSDYGVILNGILVLPRWIEFPLGFTCGLKITKHQTFVNCGMLIDIGLFFKK